MILAVKGERGQIISRHSSLVAGPEEVECLRPIEEAVQHQLGVHLEEDPQILQVLRELREL